MKHSWEGRLVSRPVRGNECESTWPPQFGTGDTTPMHINADGKLVEGRPPPTPKFGTAPAYISDNLRQPFYHHGVCRMVETRTQAERADKESGCVTTDRLQRAPGDPQKKREAERKADIHESMQKAIVQLDEGTAPISEETKVLCEQQNEIIAGALPGFDPFNAAGKVTNAKGRRWKEKHGKSGGKRTGKR